MVMTVEMCYFIWRDWLDLNDEAPQPIGLPCHEANFPSLFDERGHVLGSKDKVHHQFECPFRERGNAFHWPATTALRSLTSDTIARAPVMWLAQC